MTSAADRLKAIRDKVETGQRLSFEDGLAASNSRTTCLRWARWRTWSASGTTATSPTST